MSSIGVKSSNPPIRRKHARKKLPSIKNASTGPLKPFRSNSLRQRYGPGKRASGSSSAWEFYATKKKSVRRKNTASCRYSIAARLRSFALHGQRHKERAAPCRFAFHPNAPTMGFHDFLADSQAKPGAVAAGVLTDAQLTVLVEDVIELMRSNANAGIFDPPHYFIRAP